MNEQNKPNNTYKLFGICMLLITIAFSVLVFFSLSHEEPSEPTMEQTIEIQPQDTKFNF